MPAFSLPSRFPYSYFLVFRFFTFASPSYPYLPFLSRFRYPSRPNQKVLDGITLNIPAGTKVALVGPSGSGKSSIIQLLQRFYDPEEGQISLDGTDMKEMNVGWLRYQV